MNTTHTLIQAYTHTYIVLVSGVGEMITHFSEDAKLLSYFLIYLNNECWVFNAVQFSSVVTQLCLTLCNPMDRSTPGLPVHHQLLEFTQTHDYWVSDAIQPSHLLSSPSPPALNLSRIRVFSNESTLCMRWPKYWSFSFSISPSNEHPGLIFFR